MNLPVASYSFLNKWDTCRHQSYRMYIARDLERTPESPQQKWGNDVHHAFEHRIKYKEPFPEAMNGYERWAKPLDAYKIEPELKVGITQEGKLTGGYKGAWLFGKIDCPIILKERHQAHLIDWKTGNSKYEDRFELDIQGLLLKALHPDLTKITGQYAWLKDNRMGTIYNVSDAARTYNQVAARMSNVADAIKANDFPKSPGPLCNYCPVTDCEHNGQTA